MPNIRTMMGSKYLKKEDVPQPALVTISHCDEQEISDGEGGKEKKWVLHFNEYDKGLVLNSTNLQLCAQALGSEETEDWLGKQVVLYTDPNVSMSGKLVGGLRIRARRVGAVTPPAPAAPARPQRNPQPGKFDDMADDIPF